MKRNVKTHKINSNFFVQYKHVSFYAYRYSLGGVDE